MPVNPSLSQNTRHGYVVSLPAAEPYEKMAAEPTFSTTQISQHATTPVRALDQVSRLVAAAVKPVASNAMFQKPKQVERAEQRLQPLGAVPH